ncbi:serine protease [Thermopolyspora sp. NPDC052614]|uniref:serine protease n=1 Tax=Thermopolyspora sp. NPDC052614 TaxID=3155682 RepID=UPI00344ABB32
MDISREVRNLGLGHAEAAAERYRRSTAEREEVRRRQDQGDAFPDAPEQLASRAARLIQRSGVPVEAVMEATRTEHLDRPAFHERVLGVSKELQAYSFLPRGARAARTVARVLLCENGRLLPIGTGFLVSPRLLMTNHHVLPDARAAAQAMAEFDAQVTVDNVPDTATRCHLEPETFFIADAGLDFALVQVGPCDDGRPPGERFGWNALSADRGKLVIGEPVNIIGHPSGRLKEIAIRDNRLEVRLDDFLQYRTDTEPGSSGSPVFNDQWEVTALHHSGVPRTDEQGRILRRDGQVWREGDGDDAVDWISNEGVRISSILRRLAALRLDDARLALLAEMGVETRICDGHPSPPSGGPAGQTATPRAAMPATTAATTAAATPAAGAPQGTGAAPHPATATSPEFSPATAPVRRPSGRPARPGAFGGTRHLVFLHGRGQERHDPERLRRAWTAGLNTGLTRAGLATIEPADVWFPFYGDRLTQAVRPREAAARSLEEIAADPASAAAPPTPSARDLYENLITQAAVRAGMPAERLAPAETLGAPPIILHRALSWLAAATALDGLSIALIFADVAAYLDDRQVRESVLAAVMETLPASGRVLLVTHSLGTVVAMDLLTRLNPALDVEMLATVGSPLGLDGVYRRLLIGGPERPARVAHWLNVWCPADPVTIGCPLADDWRGELTEISVTNPVDGAHDIAEYLAHPEVAHAIGARLLPALAASLR